MKNYIFGTGPFAVEVAKKMEQFGFNVDGFLKNKDLKNSLPKKVYKNIPIFYIEEKEDIDKEKSNIIITKKPMILGNAIDYLRKNKFKNIYVVREEILFSNLSNVLEFFEYVEKIDFKIPFLNYLEMNVVDQCNLNCKGCAHFSNISDNNFVELEQYKNDLLKISQKFNLYNFRILGGEPLLHPQFADLIEYARIIFPKCTIVVVTNGLLIPKLCADILNKLAKNKIIISISLYEPTSLILDEILGVLKMYNINYFLNDDYFKEPEVIKKFQTRLGELKNKDNGDIAWKSCTGQYCHFLRNGKISKCYYPLLIEKLNEKYNTNFNVSIDDYIEIDKIIDGWDTIEKLNKKIPFCDYCQQEDYEFDWEGCKKNDDNKYNFILRKK